ncbi:hypothetical protein [Paenibacillus sp. Marseille-Q4541]|uniref:hypothetical protein n=1 Tax=Paenibacillus sp. Marseille-Q4541 TaxID=2831522 RepID=UPI001BAE4602|nr:hypothetical protein [Paenibacillus sp. Marseille-Q4541]
MSEDKTNRGAGFDSIPEPDPKHVPFDWTNQSGSMTITNLTEDVLETDDKNEDEEKKR